MTGKSPHTRLVAVDTMALVWGVRRTGPQEKIKHAQYLFQELEGLEAKIMVPSVVVAEYVTPIHSPDRRTRTIAAIAESFLIMPFDAKAAAVAADLWNAGKASRPKARTGARICLRADTMIIATAYAHGASVFYTDDTTCRALANTIMPARALPTIPPELFS